MLHDDFMFIAKNTQLLKVDFNTPSNWLHFSSSPYAKKLRIRGKKSEVMQINRKLACEDYERIEPLIQQLEDESIFNSYYKSGNENTLESVFDINSELMALLDELYEEVKDPNTFTRNILMTGERGSGKTFCQQLFLALHGRSIENDNISILRVNVHRLYKLWQDAKGNENTIIEVMSLRNYKYLCFIRSFFLNRCIDKDELAKDYYLSIHSQVLQQIPDKLYNELLEVEFEANSERYSIGSVLNHIKKHLYTKEKQHNESNFHCTMQEKTVFSFVDKLIVPSSLKVLNVSQKEVNRIVGAAINIILFLGKNDYKFMFLIDGADNVTPKQSSTKALFQKFLQEIKEISAKVERYSKHWISLRPRSTYEINANSDTGLNQDNLDLYEMPDCHFPIALEKRLNYLLSKVKRYGELGDYGKIYEQIAKYAKDNTAELNQYYNNNVRDYLNSKKYLARTMYYVHCHLKRVLNKDFISSSAHFARLYKQWVWRVKFLVDNLHLDSRTPITNIVNSKHGLFAPNPFYFDTRDINRSECRWPGLCMIRIIQYLNRAAQVERSKLVKQIHNLFQYPILIIENTILECLNFNLFEAEFSNNKTHLEITTKGQTLIIKIFEDPSLLYYFSLDCPLPKAYVDNSAISCHNNRQSACYSHFNENCINSFLTFSIFILKISEDELSQIDSKLHETFSLPLVKRGFNEKYNPSNDMISICESMSKNILDDVKKSMLNARLNRLKLVIRNINA